MPVTLPVIPEPAGQRRERLRRGVLPLVVWAVMALIAAAALVNRGRTASHVGLAHSLETQVSPTVTARVQAILVSMNEDVANQQVVALLDDAPVRALIDTAQANLRKLRADLAAAGASLAVEAGQTVTDLLRLQMDEQSRRLEALSLQATVAGDAIEVERRRLEAQRMAALSKEGLAPQSDFENARLAHEELRTRTERTRELLAQTESEWQSARARRETYERRLPAQGGEHLLLAPLREAISVEEVRLREIELQREALVLRSPVAGQVSQVWCGPGQSVRPGDPILTIVESTIRAIIVYVDDGDAQRFAPRAPVRVATRIAPRTAADSVVVSVGASVQPLPQRLWRDPRVPSYGRAVVVAPVPGLSLAGGELVDVRRRN